VVAAASQPAIEAGEAVAEVEEQSRSPLLVALPYLGTIVAFALLIGAQAGDSFFPGFSLTLTAAFVAMLVLSREALSQRELAGANAAIREAKSELEALATTDPLTALPNHRALVEALDRELNRSIRYGRPCGVLFVDIDYFKALNDSCGHAAGDSVLVELGEVMQRALRRIDTVGRWGGEEFIAVLPEVDAKEALLAAERLRAKVAEHIFDVSFGTRVTVSVGAAGYPRDGATRNHLVEAADRAMYTAKRMGRNQVFDAADPAVAALRRAGQDGSELDERATMGAVDALATLVETRDKGTDDHSQKMARLAEQIALVMGCTPQQARDVFLAARLHDIGKVAVADAILRKPGKLTEEEWDLMRKHPTVGADVVSKVWRLANLAPIIRAHHEHYDGGGYPGGLKGRDIPLEARIVGVADAFDAMTSDRPYRGSLKLDEAREELRRYAGSQFDPEVVAVLDSILGEEAEAEASALRSEQ
jgi:diguanylate cyclase (GGDEF)-like protein/putative nucleotidyltransferase with HDIG domain